MKSALLGQAAKITNYGRIGLYSLESLPIIAIRKLRAPLNRPDPTPPEDHFAKLKKELAALVQEDSQNIENGVYPLSLLTPESPLSHARRFSHLLVDSFLVGGRIKEKQHKVFSKKAKSLFEGLPEYYKRNFHNQTDGYLSDSSANLYDHQTEILFKGSIGLMRRILLAPLINQINSKNQKVRLLEFGCGAGQSTEILLRSCPRLEIKAMDLSEPYMKMASSRLNSSERIQFVRGAAENYDSIEKFDFVFSSFLFHEIPKTIREKIMNKSKSLLQPGGRFFHIDSIQLGDEPGFDWALIQFPKDFHEPYYRSYVENPVEKELAQFSSQVEVRRAFLSKSFSCEV